MALTITSNLPATDENFKIAANPPAMPTITVTAAMQDGGRLPGNATFEWSATLEFNSSLALYGGKRNTRHPDIAPQTGPNPSWDIPFTEISGGKLVVKLVMRAGLHAEHASKEWDIVGTNPADTDIRTFANSIGANRVAFRKLMRKESSLEQFHGRDNYWPLYSRDREGGVGLCQLTNPAPSDAQTWNWQENVRGGWDLYQAKEREARGYPGRKQQSAEFRALVDTLNRQRTRQNLPELIVNVPAYTEDQLMRATLRRFNGGNEYRLRRVNGILAVTISDDGRHGMAEWEVMPVAERIGPGDHNYVENVLSKADY